MSKEGFFHFNRELTRNIIFISQIAPIFFTIVVPLQNISKRYVV